MSDYSDDDQSDIYYDDSDEPVLEVRTLATRQSQLPPNGDR